MVLKPYSTGDSLILDKDLAVVSNSVKVGSPENLLELIIRSMKVGDRKLFYHFCEADSLPCPFEVIRLLKYGNAFVFLEKIIINSSPMTLCILGEKITDFISFMSPDTELYRTETGRLIYELAVSIEASEGEENVKITPEALTCYSKAPLLFDELLSPMRNVKECDIARFIEMICGGVMSSSLFGGAVVSLDNVNSPAKPSFYPINPASLVHVCTGLIHIAAYLSSDNKVSVSLDCHPDGVIADFSCTTSYALTSDCGSFLEIAETFPDLRYTASALGAIANALDFMPTVRSENGRLSIRIKAAHAIDDSVTFKYSDPYSIIIPALSEAVSIMDFFHSRG